MVHGRSLSWVADEARSLRDRGALRGKAWSLAQVCEHLALAVQGTVDSQPPGPGSAAPPEWWRSLNPLVRLQRRVMKHALLWSGRFPEGVPSPKIVVPSDSADLDTMIERLESAAAAFGRKRAQTDARWIHHPLLGPMNGQQWERFHTLHARHHYKFMKAE